MQPLSVVIITFNEERNIARCIQSVVDIADEIVVVDSYSTDRTRSICEQFDVRFIQHKWPGYGAQKHYAVLQASHNLILSLDADEAPSQQLCDSIKAIKHTRDADGYTMNRRTNYCGKWINHCGWYPDRKLRLFDRLKGQWQIVAIHEKFEMEKGALVKHLNGDLLHYSYYTSKDHYKQIENFSKIAAAELYQSKKYVRLPFIYLKVAAQFLKTWLLRKGFLDGRMGWLIAKRSAYATYRKYILLKNLHE
ncbi:MAG: glycosyltransferase family 2 protein, partial [Bacteroidales bacterium]|nr:glycosyltransferase family 2 protein [Bacteroidales bacterium]